MTAAVTRRYPISNFITPTWARCTSMSQWLGRTPRATSMMRLRCGRGRVRSSGSMGLVQQRRFLLSSHSLSTRSVTSVLVRGRSSTSSLVRTCGRVAVVSIHIQTSLVSTLLVRSPYSCMLVTLLSTSMLSQPTASHSTLRPRPAHHTTSTTHRSLYLLHQHLRRCRMISITLCCVCLHPSHPSPASYAAMQR